MPKKASAAKKTAVKSSALILHRRKDGTVTMRGDAPSEHKFTPKFLGRMAAEGWGSLVATLNVEGEKVSYELVGPVHADPANTDSAIIEYEFRRVAGKKGK